MTTPLDIEKNPPLLKVAFILLRPQSNKSPVEVEKKVSTEKVEPHPIGGIATTNETISQYSCG